MRNLLYPNRKCLAFLKATLATGYNRRRGLSMGQCMIFIGNWRVGSLYQRKFPISKPLLKRIFSTPWANQMYLQCQIQPVRIHLQSVLKSKIEKLKSCWGFQGSWRGDLRNPPLGFSLPLSSWAHGIVLSLLETMNQALTCSKDY